MKTEKRAQLSPCSTSASRIAHGHIHYLGAVSKLCCHNAVLVVVTEAAWLHIDLCGMPCWQGQHIKQAVQMADTEAQGVMTERWLPCIGLGFGSRVESSP